MELLQHNGRWLLLCFLVAGLVQATWSQQSCDIRADKRLANCRGQSHLQVPQDLPVSIEMLDLSYNKLTQIKRGEFYVYTNLRQLNLSYNNISRIDKESFASNVRLEQLSLFNNSLMEMPTSLLKNLQNLQMLDLSNNFYNTSALGEVFSTLVNLKVLSVGGPLVRRVLKDDFVPLKDIHLQKFSLKTTSSLEFYEEGAFSVLNTNTLWFDIALDTNENALPHMLKDLAGKSFDNLRFRNLFEFTYYQKNMDLFSGLAEIDVKELVFYRGKFNENLLRLALLNIQKSHIQDLSLLSIDFARSLNSSISDIRINDLSLNKLVLKDISNPDILRFDWTFTWFRKIINLYIINVNFNFVPCDAWDEMKSMEMLNISDNRLLDSYIYNPSCHYHNVVLELQTFIASHNKLTSLKSISLLAASWPKLTHLDLGHNLIGALSESCTWAPNITSLILCNNQVNANVFKCLPTSLKYLDMANSQLDRVDINYFNQATNLRTLILSNNKIKFIPSDWKSPNLEVLVVDGNSFGVISGGSFQHMHQLKTLTAGNNPYHCTCDFYTFITETLQDNQLLLTDWPDDYMCYHPQYLLDTKVELYTPGRLECDVKLVVAISVSSTAVIVIICMLLCWRFDVPWYLKATCHIVRSKYHSKNAEVDKVYTYHAFISYSHSDADWVRREMLYRLENCSPPYRVCIHERDFLPGKWIIDNIIDNIESSHKIIFVLSHSFVNSEWCNYELYFAHQRAIGHAFEDVILVVKENISMESLPKKFCKLRKMLSTKTYLEWPLEQIRQPFFWIQLKSTLGKVTTGVTRQDSVSLVNRDVVLELPAAPEAPIITVNTVNLPCS
ncbi:hypothetical protein FKM82_016291 [Ascaphus truei]